jgi:hypothetical protein
LGCSRTCSPRNASTAPIGARRSARARLLLTVR